MGNVCVVVADAARARFFSLEGSAERGVKGGPDLVEHEVLVNPEAMLQGKEKYSDNKSGRTQSAAGVTHGHDDHRDRHEAEEERRFARRIAGEAMKLVDRQKASSLVLAAEVQLLGMLRQALPASSKVKVQELPKDLSKLTATELHQYLAGEKIVPARTPA